MSKSYKCFFCKFERGPLRAINENCTDCKYGSNFELVPKMYPRQKYDWKQHQELDEFLKLSDAHLTDYQNELIHRLLDVRYGRKISNRKIISALEATIAERDGCHESNQ